MIKPIRSFSLLLLILGLVCPSSQASPVDLFPLLKTPIHPMVIAHRGYSRIAPENTLSAFQEAIDIGADMIELDVALSKDGELVVIHDATLERTTNGKGRVKEHTLAELKMLDAGSWFHSKYAQEKIPTLKEALQLCKNKILVNIEIKHNVVNFFQFGKGISHQVVELVGEMNMKEEVLISSFHPFAIMRVESLDPELRTSYLYDKKMIPPKELIAWTRADSVSLNKDLLNLDRLKEAHKEGWPTRVYTVNDPEEMKAFIAFKVDGIFTDDPARLIQLLKSQETFEKLSSALKTPLNAD